jgi:GTP cyclohydrolase-4
MLVPMAKRKGLTRKKRTWRGRCQDIQDSSIEGGFYLTRVGITGVKKPLTVHRPKGTITLTPTIDIAVDLPARQKGSHMSRNAEVLNELVDSCFQEPCGGLEHICAHLSRLLLERHDYAKTSEVRMSADYFLERKGLSGRTSMEPYKILAMARATKGGDGKVTVEKMIGVEVMGITACPCAMDTVRAMLEDQGHVVSDDFPNISHNQRNNATVTLEVPEAAEIEADDLIDIVESSMSSPTYGILKRGDEANLVMNAHKNPKFVEDVVRDILTALLKMYKALPDSTKVAVKSVAEESIHKHDAFAERVTTFGELRKKI